MAYSTISKPSLHFNIKLYTGTGSSNAITGVGFQPDFVWLKDRGNSTAQCLFDAPRGAGKRIQTNSTDAEYTNVQQLSSFDSDGFTVGTNGDANGNGADFVSLNWKANGQGSSNSDGTINTTYTSVNTTAGFSISTYTGNGVNGATVGHGLGAVPKLVWIKRLSNADAMIQYHHRLGNAASFKLDRTDGSNTGNFWNSTTPTSSVVTMTNSTECNVNGQTYVMYCFAEIKGFSKVEEFKGNSTNNFIYTGFAPALIIAKTNATDWWSWQDNKRLRTSHLSKLLFPNTGDAETNGVNTRCLSNGFLANTTNTGFNNSSYTTYFIAFAAETLVANVGESIPVTAK